ncbi:hypothetical protein EMPS_01152 [Entomortierella parvispora]|uniref:Uncharacterized protein n=1 Tax=Entomortierella parvispora TaxID=205924 RepID=A0A9P3H2A1_9FUNG|nr:hypothetical protein EMPS_01152 [Entomortierella parvispora]
MASIPIPRRYHRIVYLPSKHDDSHLEVLLSIPTTISSTSPQLYTGVVIAHPYGPLGGSYNNNVVGALLQWFETQPLQVKSEETGNVNLSSSTRESRKTSSVPLECVIAAFNFRGSGKSKGKTSWTGEAERQDYQTVVDFLQSGTRATPLGASTERHDSGTGTPASTKVYDETGEEIDPPRLPSMSRFILAGFSYGGLVASTIPPPLRFTASPESGHLPTSYIFVSYPAGVAWFLTTGYQGSFFQRAKTILLGENIPSDSNSDGTIPKPSTAKVEAFFISGSEDQFTSPTTLMNWLKINAGMSPPASQNNAGPASWAVTRPDGAIHVEVLDGVDHFWLDKEQKLLGALKNWWNDCHPVS